VSWLIGGEGDQEREMRKCSGRSLWCAGRLRVSGRLLWGRRWGRLLVWERNRGNGEPWVYGRRPK